MPGIEAECDNVDITRFVIVGVVCFESEPQKDLVSI